MFTFLLVGFAITNMLVFLHVGHWFRKLVSGLTDTEFFTMMCNPTPRLTTFRHVWLGRLVRCHACMGFWVGLGMSLVCGPNAYFCVDCGLYYADAVGDGLLVSGSNFIVWLVCRKLGAE